MRGARKHRAHNRRRISHLREWECEWNLSDECGRTVTKCPHTIAAKQKFVMILGTIGWAVGPPEVEECSD